MTYTATSTEDLTCEECSTPFVYHDGGVRIARRSKTGRIFEIDVTASVYRIGDPDYEARADLCLSCLKELLDRKAISR